MNIAKVLLIISALAALIYAASPKAKLNTAPPATQAAVETRSPNATPVSLSQEKEEDGKSHNLVAVQKAPAAEVEDDDDDANEINEGPRVEKAGLR
jgi:hypothetical protein